MLLSSLNDHRNVNITWMNVPTRFLSRNEILSEKRKCNTSKAERCNVESTKGNNYVSLTYSIQLFIESTSQVKYFFCALF